MSRCRRIKGAFLEWSCHMEVVAQSHVTLPTISQWVIRCINTGRASCLIPAERPCFGLPSSLVPLGTIMHASYQIRWAMGRLLAALTAAYQEPCCSTRRILGGLMQVRAASNVLLAIYLIT